MLKKLMLLSVVAVAVMGLVGCGERTNEQKATDAMDAAKDQAADAQKESEKAADEAGKAASGMLDGIKK